MELFLIGQLWVGLISRDHCIIKYKLLIDFISVTHFYFLLYWEKMGSIKSLQNYIISVRNG